MRRLREILTLIVLIAVLAGPTAALAQMAPAGGTLRAQAGADLAVYFPRETLVYASVDVSAGRIETLDALLARVQAALPPEVLDPMMAVSVTMLLDMVTGELNGKTFAESVRPWLGDRLALGVLPPDYLFDYDWNNDDQTPVLVAAEVTDRGAASSFVSELLTNAGMVFDVNRIAAYDLFDVESYDFTGYVMVRDDVLLIATEQAYLPTDGLPVDHLGTNPYFAETLALLPGADYGIMAYIDTPMLLANVIGSEYNEDPGARLLLTLVLRMLGPTAVGGSLIGGETLALDVAQAVGNVTVLEALGVTFTPLPASDLRFLGALPASTALIIQGNSLAQTAENGLQSGRTLVDQFILPQLDDQTYADQQAAMVLELVDLLLSGLTGISYARDLRPWMQGEFALFAGYNPDFRKAAPVTAENFPLHLGALFEVSEDGADAARNFVELFGRELELALRVQGVEGVDIRTMTHGAALMTAVTISDPNAYREPMDVLTLAVATDGDLMAIGTLAAVDAVLMGTGPRFEPVMPEVLEGASLVLYAAPPALLPLLDLVQADMAESDVELLRLLIDLLPRATISAYTTAEGDGVIRATLTLGG